MGVNVAKKLSFLMVFALLFFFIAGCGGEEPPIGPVNPIGNDVNSRPSVSVPAAPSSVAVSSVAASVPAAPSSVAVSSVAASVPSAPSSVAVSSVAVSVPAAPSSVAASVPAVRPSSVAVSSVVASVPAVRPSSVAVSSVAASVPATPSSVAAARYSLTMSVNGQGTVAANPQRALYSHGERVLLTATPATGWRFVRWEGNAWGSENPFNATIWHHSTVTAVFEISGPTVGVPPPSSVAVSSVAASVPAVQNFTLTTSVTGQGTISRSPNNTSYARGTTVQLTANPAAGWTFSRWEGGATGSTSPVSVTIQSNTTVTAVFVQTAVQNFTLTTSVTGQGTISRSPNNTSYARGTTVQLTANPAAGWTFSRWEGGATGSTSPVSVTIQSNTTVTAVFVQTPVSPPPPPPPTVPGDGRLANITRSCAGITMPGPVAGSNRAWASRYWDCCKPHCGWSANANPPSTTCGRDGRTRVDANTTSGCDGGGAFTCYNQIPFAVCEDLSYGFAAVHAPGVQCGRCYLLEFDGGFQHGTAGPAHQSLVGKRMIVMASNIGHDVQANQFDLMIPGGGLGAFTSGCAAQWGVDVNNAAIVGARYGGFTTRCQEQLGGNASMEAIKTCVRGMCNNLFGRAGMESLLEGCIWYVDWMNAANNPTFRWSEIACPAELRSVY